jgi:hypothetical protein
LQKKRFAPQFPLAVDDLTGGEAFSESLQEPLALSGAEVLHGTVERIIILPRRASCRGAIGVGGDATRRQRVA